MKNEKWYGMITSRRSIRQFQPHPLEHAVLKDIVNAGRLAPSAANLQPLEFIAVAEEGLRRELFACLKWAAYIAPAGNPPPGREPAAYIVVLVDTRIREKMYEYDVGAAVENMILASLGEGIGSCWLISIDRDKAREILKVPEPYRIDSVLALGYPAEEPAAEDLIESCRYWKDETGRLHVPKRRLASVLHVDGYSATWRS